MDFPEADDPLEQIANRVVKRAVKSSPWFALSLAFHAAGFALLPLIMFSEKLAVPESTPVQISMDAKRLDPDRFYKPMSGGPPSAEGLGLDEPTISFPDALPAERNESKNSEDHGQISGESYAALSHFTDEAAQGSFRGRLLKGPPGTNDVMGVGGGSGMGMRYGGKLGGRQNLVARGGGSSATEAAVEAGLAWLARHQEPDGSWVTMGDYARCKKCSIGAGLRGCEVGVTALAALAYIGAGYGPGCGEGSARDPSTGKTLRYGDTVRSALRYLERNLEESGRFKGIWGEGHSLAPMYNQAFATLAFCEAFRATKSDHYKALAEKSLTWLQNARSYTSGWRYVPNTTENDVDLSVTGACVQALRSAQLSGLPVMEKARAGVESFVSKVTNEDGEAGYQFTTRKIRKLGAAMPAIGVYVWRFATPKERQPNYDKAAATVVKNVIEKTGYSFDMEFTSDAYCWYYAMLSLFDAEGPRGVHFKAVNSHVTRSLCKLQERYGCGAGSWDASTDLYMRHGGGRACATALDVLTLEVYYRYATDR